MPDLSLNLNMFFDKLSNFKNKFTNDLDAKPREIQVSNMPLEFLVWDNDLNRYLRHGFEEINLNEHQSRVIIKLK